MRYEDYDRRIELRQKQMQGIRVRRFPNESFDGMIERYIRLVKKTTKQKSKRKPKPTQDS